MTHINGMLEYKNFLRSQPNCTNKDYHYKETCIVMKNRDLELIHQIRSINRDSII